MAVVPEVQIGGGEEGIARIRQHGGIGGQNRLDRRHQPLHSHRLVGHRLEGGGRRLQRRHQRFGDHGEGFVVTGFARDDAASGDALQLVVLVGVDPHLGQGDRQPYRLLVMPDLGAASSSLGRHHQLPNPLQE